VVAGGVAVVVTGVDVGGAGSGAAASTGGSVTGATCVGASDTGSPGTGGCCAPDPSGLALKAIATTPAVHSAATNLLRLVRSVLASCLTFISGVLPGLERLVPTGRWNGYRHGLAIA
jgi:hypothetical protein